MGRYEIYLDKAYDAIDRRAYNEAIQWCKKAIDADPSGPAAHHARGEALDASGMWEEALQCFDRAIERDPEFVEAMLSKAEILSDRTERVEEALPLCDAAVRLLDAENDDERYLLAEASYIRGNALQSLDRLEDALLEYDRALELVPEHPDYLSERGILLYYLLDYEGAEANLRAAAEADPENADVRYTLGLLLEKTEREEEARASFAEANRVDAARHPLVLRVTREKFEAEVEAAMGALPPDFTRHMENVVVVVEDFPRREQLVEAGLDPQILGLFEGRTQEETAKGLTALPTQITLFQRNLEKICESESELREEIRVTVMHEVGHYFGLSEDELQALGLE